MRNDDVKSNPKYYNMARKYDNVMGGVDVAMVGKVLEHSAKTLYNAIIHVLRKEK